MKGVKLVSSGYIATIATKYDVNLLAPFLCRLCWLKSTWPLPPWLASARANPLHSAMFSPPNSVSFGVTAQDVSLPVRIMYTPIDPLKLLGRWLHPSSYGHARLNQILCCREGSENEYFFMGVCLSFNKRWVGCTGDGRSLLREDAED